MKKSQLANRFRENHDRIENTNLINLIHMKVYKTKEIKNISLLGSDGAGKTTLTEALLYESGQIQRRGRITAKNTVSDYFPVEQEYGYSVFATPFHTEWNGKKLNFIDCPGSDDFIGATITALSVTDTAVIMINGQNGPEVATHNHFRYTEKLNKPVIFLINRLDDEKCDYDNIIEQLRSIYGSKVVPVQYPVKTGPDFNTMIDVLLMKKYSWKPEGGAPTIEAIPADQAEKAAEWHAKLVEAAAENDETLMEKFFDTENLTEDEMREGIRKGLIERNIFPVFCVCASKDMGVRRMMEFLGNVVPFVDEMPKVTDIAGNEVKPDSEGPTSIYFFKTGIEPHIGEVQYFKVMSGTVREGDDLTNADKGSKERIAQLFCPSGSIREKVSELQAGDIGCTVKLKDVKRGNTLNGKDCEYRFNFIKYPDNKYTRAIKAVNESETEKMMSILNRMHEEDPTWVVEQSKELRQTLVHGQGEFHLRTLKWRLENNEKIQVEFGEPRDHNKSRTRRLPPQETKRRRGAIRRSPLNNRTAWRKHARTFSLQVRRAGIPHYPEKPGDNRTGMGRQTRIHQFGSWRRNRHTLYAGHTERRNEPHGTRTAHRLIRTRCEGYRIRRQNAPRRLKRNLLHPRRTQRIQRSVQRSRPQNP